MSPAVMQATAAHLERDETAREPGLAAKRTELAAALSVDLATVPVLLARLHDAAAAPDYLFTDAPVDSSKATKTSPSIHCSGHGHRGSTAEITRRIWTQRLAFAGVGELIPVRYDRADRSRIIIDGPEMKAERKAWSREIKDYALKRGERELDRS